MGAGSFDRVKIERRKGIEADKTGEGSRVEKNPDKKFLRREKKLAERVKDIGGKKEFLEFLGTLKKATPAGGKKSNGSSYLEQIQAFFDGKIGPDDIKSKVLANKAIRILELENPSLQNKGKPDNTGKLFKSLGRNLSQDAERAKVVLRKNSETAPPGAKVTPLEEDTAVPLDPEQLEVSSLGVEVVPSEESEEIRPEATGPEKDPKPKKPEEDPEDKERRTQERQDKLAQLKTEIDQARKEYLEDEYNKTKSYARLGNFFGKIRSMLKDDSRKAEEEYKKKRIGEDSDLAQYRAYYDNKLFEYKNLLLEDAKERGVSNKELGELVKVFALEANMNMDYAHTEVRMENHSGQISENLKNLSLKMIDSYKKLPTGTKLAIGLGFFGIGALTGAAGLGVSAWASATVLRRFFMGAVTGTSITAGLESRGRGNAEGEIEKVSGAFSDKLGHLTDEQKINITQEAIGEIIYDDKNSLNQIKSRKARNLAAGVGIAALVGTSSHWIEMLKHSETAQEIFGGIKGGVGKVMAMLGNQEGTIEGTGTADITDNNPEFPGYKEAVEKALREAKIPVGVGADNAVAPFGPGAVSAETPSAAGAGSHAEAPAVENPVADAGENTVLKVEGNSGREGAIIEYLDKHPEAMEKYNELHGDRGFDSGDIAHRMAKDYAKENGIPFGRLNHALAGQKLELSPDGTRIMDMEISGDEHAGDLPGEGVPEGAGEVETDSPEADSADEAAGSEAETSPEDQSAAPQAEQVPVERAENVISAPKEVMIEEFKLDDATSVKVNNLNSRINDLNAEINEIDKRIEHIKIGAYPSDGNTVDKLVAEKESLTKDAFYLAKERNEAYGLSVIKHVSGNDVEKWREIKNLPANQLVKDKNGLVYKFYAKISGDNIANFKGNIKPNPGETLEKWIPRIVRMRTCLN